METKKRLHLSTEDKKIAGVCGGIAEYLGGIDSTIVRIIFLIAVFCPYIPGLIVYLIFWLAMPKADGNEI